MSRAYVRRIAIGGVTLATVAATATAASAAHEGDVGKITYNVGSTVYVANQDGTGASVLASGVNGNGAWSPDGSRFAFASTDGSIKTVRHYGGAALSLTDPVDGTAIDPAWSAYGQRVYFSRGGRLWYTSSDGSYWETPLNENPGGGVADVNPSVSDTNEVIFERSGAVYKYDPGNPGSPTKLVDAASSPDYAPGGDTFVYVSGGNLWTADNAGGNQTQLTTDGVSTNPAFSADGTSVVYSTTGNVVKKVDVESKQSTTVKDNGSAPSSQGVRRNVVQRVWGADGTDTAIATSRWNYLDHGTTSDDFGRVPAKAVVLSRSDTYLDALVGSALAINKQAPLLITARGNAVEPRVLAEINRILGTSGDIYLLGGTLALPAGVENQLISLGYAVHRIWGATHYDTAIEINKQITTDPAVAIVTTGANYYDALAAGAAAGFIGNTVIVLTDGVNMPAASANYLNSLSPYADNGGTDIVAAGGPGNTALINAYNRNQLWAWGTGWGYYKLVGNNEMDTALQLARFFFTAPVNVAISTNRGWQDALTGGAMIGAASGPLLLTNPTAIYGPVGDYLSNGAGSIVGGVMLGGYLALPDALITPIGNSISVTGQFDYVDGTAGIAKNGLRKQTVTPKADADGKTKKVPGLTTVAPTTVK